MLLYLLTPRNLFEKALNSGSLKQREPFYLYNKSRMARILEEKITPENYENFVLLVISTKKLHTNLKKKDDIYYLTKKIPVEFFEDIIEFDYVNEKLCLFTSSGAAMPIDSLPPL